MINWIVTAGKAEIKDDVIKYKSETFKNQLGNDEILSAIIKSNVYFDNGSICFTVNSKSQNGRCQLLLNNDDSEMILVGLNVAAGLFGISRFNKSNNNWENLSSSALVESYNIKLDYHFEVRVVGSIIDLYVNEILVATAFEQLTKTQATFFISSNDDVVIKNIQINPKKPKAFIVMQFTEEYNLLYNEVIKPVVESYGYECERADEVHTTNPILQDIIQSIRVSSIIIADITPNNPNVFYEVGYAHATNKPTILLCDRKRDKLPFDISGFRTLFYDNTIAGKSAVERNLKKYLETQSST